MVPLRDRDRVLNIVARGARPALPFLVGRTFRLAAGARAYHLTGYDPLVCASLVRSPSGRYVMYGAANRGWPSLEVLELSTGARFVFRSHACDPAWGEDDEIAYVHYVRFDSDTGATSGEIRVQHGLRGPPRAWTSNGPWANPIWAGHDLLADDFNAMMSLNDVPLMILYGPDHKRPVGGHIGGLGPFFTVVALNPTGTEALLDTQRPGPGGAAPGSEDLAALLRVSDDRILSRALLARNEEGAVEALAPDGDWRGDEIIATNGNFLGGYSNPPATLITLTVHGGRLRLRSAKSFLEHGYLPEGDVLTGSSQPRFLGSRLRHVAVWYSPSAVQPLEYLSCNTLNGRCTSSRNYVSPTGATFVSNPSRP
jgi:hypothetical protein